MPYGVPERLAYVVPDVGADDADAPSAFLMPLPDGPPVVLRGSAAVIWVLAADGEPDVADAVSRTVGLEREVVAAEVDRFVADLVMRGLLSVNPAASTRLSP